ncbi:MAG: DNA methyltransferase, partial [Nanoarchaeota archaeon]
TGLQIPGDYIKAKAQVGEMKSALYAIAFKTNKGLEFHPPEKVDLDALEEAEKELKRLRPAWEKANVIPNEYYPEVTTDERPRLYGMPKWADMFSPRQLLCMGVLVDELIGLKKEIIATEGKDLGDAIIHLLAFTIDKFSNFNDILSSWSTGTQTIRGIFDRHDFSFKPTWAEMAPCNADSGYAWAIDNVMTAYENLSSLPRQNSSQPVDISLGSATNLPQIHDKSITAIVVDPPYADNVQYSELADFFYVWLKRTQGFRRPEWFSTYLCEHDEEAVVNVSRHKDGGKTAEAKQRANAFYQEKMSAVFKECRRILRDDGVLTVMFTHKKQEAWESLFTSLINAGFKITATWPIKTESEHSLHQAKKNAAQSTVILVARKREEGSGIGYFDSTMKNQIRERARSTAERLQKEGLNPVDQLVGTFGPAMEVYSRYDEVRTDTGAPVSVDKAIDEASDAVSTWRIEQLSERGLDGIEPEGKFFLLCWDVLGAAEFRFNEAKLLGHASGMDMDQLIVAGLVTKTGDKIKMLSAKDRRRERALEPDEVHETLFGFETIKKKRTKKQILKIHPNDPQFRTTLDACHALALRYIEAGGGSGGIGSAKACVRQQRWTKDSPVASLMEALVHAAPEALRFDKGKKSAAAQFPEFLAWHALLEPLFGIKPPEWVEKKPAQGTLLDALEEEDEEEEEDNG